MPEEFKDGWANRWLQRGFRPVQSAQYVYQNDSGQDVVRKTRFSLMRVADGKDSGEKTFVVQHRTIQSVRLDAPRWEPGIGKEGWERGLLYRKVQLLAAIESGETVYLCEGERDADTVSGWDVCATSHYQGAAGMRPDQAEVLARAKRLFILADRDVTGYQLAWHHLTLLVRAGLALDRIRVVLPKVRDDKADITDHVKAGFGPEDVVKCPIRALRKQILKHGTLATGAKRKWGYGYGAESLGDWTVTRA